MSSYTTLSQALRWVESAAGISATNERDKAVEMANRIRRHFYNLYAEANQTFTVEGCFEVQKYCVSCNNCQETYDGITLPKEFAGPEAAWRNNMPIKMFGRWREYRWGIQDDHTCRIQIFDMGDDYPTEREICPCGEAKRMSLQSTRREDCGKQVKLDYYDADGQRFEERMVLTLEPTLTTRPIRGFARPGGVILPADRKGTVILADESGRVLSRYAPDEVVPAYRRLKVTGLEDCPQVLIRATRRFAEVFEDEDVVENNNILAWEAAARYLKFIQSTDPSGAYEQKALAHAAICKKELIGAADQGEGRGFIKQVRLNMGPRRHGRLFRNLR
jgi:hypothetical protein